MEPLIELELVNGQGAVVDAFDWIGYPVVGEILLLEWVVQAVEKDALGDDTARLVVEPLNLEAIA